MSARPGAASAARAPSPNNSSLWTARTLAHPTVLDEAPSHGVGLRRSPLPGDSESNAGGEFISGW